jgi:hypothetical protein
MLGCRYKQFEEEKVAEVAPGDSASAEEKGKKKGKKDKGDKKKKKDKEGEKDKDKEKEKGKSNENSSSSESSSSTSGSGSDSKNASTSGSVIGKDQAERVQRRIMYLLKVWVEEYFEDFYDQLLEQLIEFLNQAMSKEGGNTMAMPNRILHTIQDYVRHSICKTSFFPHYEIQFYDENYNSSTSIQYYFSNLKMYTT